MTPLVLDDDTLAAMRIAEQRWAREAGDETAEFSDWRRNEARIIHSELRSDGTRVSYLDNGGVHATGPLRTVTSS